MTAFNPKTNHFNNNRHTTINQKSHPNNIPNTLFPLYSIKKSDEDEDNFVAP